MALPHEARTNYPFARRQVLASLWAVKFSIRIQRVGGWRLRLIEMEIMAAKRTAIRMPTASYKSLELDGGLTVSAMDSVAAVAVVLKTVEACVVVAVAVLLFV